MGFLLLFREVSALGAQCSHLGLYKVQMLKVPRQLLSPEVDCRSGVRTVLNALPICDSSVKLRLSPAVVLSLWLWLYIGNTREFFKCLYLGLTPTGKGRGPSIGIFKCDSNVQLGLRTIFYICVSNLGVCPSCMED